LQVLLGAAKHSGRGSSRRHLSGSWMESPAVGAYLAQAAVGRSIGESGRFSPPFAAGQESFKLGNVTSKIRRQRFEEDEIKAVALSRTMRFKHL